MCRCAHGVCVCGRLAGFFGLGMPLRGVLEPTRMMVRAMCVGSTAMRFGSRFMMFCSLGVLSLGHNIFDPGLVTEIGNTRPYRMAVRKRQPRKILKSSGDVARPLAGGADRYQFSRSIEVPPARMSKRLHNFRIMQTTANLGAPRFATFPDHNV